MCNWTAWWFRPNGDKSAKEIAEQVAEQAVASVRRDSGKRVPTDIRSMTSAIRAELDLIDRVHGTVPAKPRGPLE